ncbi:transposase [Nocardia amamiensis]|uniref:transposase n=1 Tax=Nocardia amamiensis TaxID=404578 RepID=UPI0008363DA4
MEQGTTDEPTRCSSDCRQRECRDSHIGLTLTNLPLHGFGQNQIWCEIVCLATELTAWMQTLALTDHPARRWEPKRLRLRLFSTAARLARHARRTQLRFSAHWPWTGLITAALARLQPG